jgi:hypothetical protein
MSTLFLDLIQDLREKRLWPIAVALLAATAAVPLVLFKPAGSQPVTGPATGASAGPQGLPVVNVSNGAGDPSKLNEFAEKNPFKPMMALKKGAAASSAGSGSGGSGSGGTGGAGSASTPGGGGAGGGGATGGTPSGGGGGGGSVGTDRKYYAFRVNVEFGPRGHEKSYKDVKQLSMLPDDKSPVVVFMGMSADFKTAIFLIDNGKFQADGEGKCRPSADACSFVELDLHDSGNEETLAALDGSNDYTLKLTKISRVFLTPDEAKGDAQDSSTPSSPKAASKKAKAAGADSLVATGGKATGDGIVNPLQRLFELPSFATQ